MLESVMDYQSTPMAGSSRRRLEGQPSLEANKKIKISHQSAGGVAVDDPSTNAYAHWWFTDYASSIQDTLMKREKLRLEFCLQSPNLEYRDHCVNIIRTFAISESLMRSTVHLAVYLLDSFMDNHTIAIERLALVALTSMILASKMEEHEPNVTQPHYLNTRIDQPYSINDYKQLECMILRFFDFQLNIPTAVTFIEYYIEGITDAQDFELANLNSDVPFNSPIDMKRNMADLAFEFIDLMLTDVRLVQAPPSKMAAACLAAARQCSKFCYIWSSRLARLTRYKLIDIDCYMKRLLLMRMEFVEEQQQSEKFASPDSGYLTSEHDEDCYMSG